jgi:hypothetical protein
VSIKVGRKWLGVTSLGNHSQHQNPPKILMQCPASNKGFAIVAVLMVLSTTILNGCTNTKQISSTESSKPDAWEARLARIERGDEQFETAAPGENTLDLDKKYERAQDSLEDRFEKCFKDVFSNKTFDAGVPWKSEGQGVRQVLVVTKEKEVQHWSINKSVRKCEKYFSEPFQGVEEKKLVVRVRKLPYMYKFEEGGNLLCKYREDDMWQGGVTRHCNTRMPVFIPG